MRGSTANWYNIYFPTFITELIFVYGTYVISLVDKLLILTFKLAGPLTYVLLDKLYVSSKNDVVGNNNVFGVKLEL